ncbi:MAG: hypothetical protein CMF41_03365 [Legionellales bacterium]|nr:hypothetical protein [Legionellales bacterium]
MVRKVTKEDIEYIQQQKFAFVTLSTTSFGEVDPDNKINQTVSLTSLMGLPVLYECLKDKVVMSTSLGYSREETFDDDQILEPKAAAIDEPRFNSHRQQIFKTAGEMILLALEQGWKVVKIEEGSDLFKWSTWAISKANGLSVEGYEPDEEGLAAYERSETLIDPYVYQKTQSYVPVLGASESYDDNAYLNPPRQGGRYEATDNPVNEPSSEPTTDPKPSSDDAMKAEPATDPAPPATDEMDEKAQPKEPVVPNTNDKTNEQAVTEATDSSLKEPASDVSSSETPSSVSDEPIKQDESTKSPEATASNAPKESSKVVGFSPDTSKVTPIKKEQEGGMAQQIKKDESKPFSFSEEGLTEEELKELRELEKKDEEGTED